MPIEFRCTSCQKLLRTPDESAGKKAKCPHCGAFVDIPIGAGSSMSSPGTLEPSTSISPAEQPAPSAAAFAANPFVDSAATNRTAHSASDNPYASPSAPASSYTIAKVAKTEPRHTLVTLDDLLNHTWTIFTSQIGPLILLGLIPFGISIAQQLISMIANVAAQATGEQAIVIVVQITFGILGFVIQTWLSVGMVVYMSNFLRSGQPNLRDLLDCGRYFFRVILANIVMGFLMLGLLLIFAVPALLVVLIQGPNNVGREPLPIVVVSVICVLLFLCVWFWVIVRFLLVHYFLIDRDQGIFQAFGSSSAFMRGNIGVAFLAMLVVGMVGFIFLICTCGLGQLVYVPYLSLFLGVLYMTATGQATFDRPATFGLTK